MILWLSVKEIIKNFKSVTAEHQIKPRVLLSVRPYETIQISHP